MEGLAITARLKHERPDGRAVFEESIPEGGTRHVGVIFLQPGEFARLGEPSRLRVTIEGGKDA